jgi:DNA-binding Lrp family transcriptional regulator
MKDKISALDMAVLNHLSKKKTPEEIAELTKTEPQVVGQKIARLQVEGYITAEGYLTEKGFGSLRGESIKKCGDA